MEQAKPTAAITRLPAARKPARKNASPAVRGRLKLVELLLEVSRRMAAYDTLDDVLRALVEMTTAELDAERGTLFLNDAETNELYSRVAQGNIRREIRILNTSGIAGYVFTSGESVLIQRRLFGSALQPLDRRADRFRHAQYPVRADPDGQRRNHRRGADAEQEEGRVHQARSRRLEAMTSPGRDGAARRGSSSSA